MKTNLKVLPILLGALSGLTLEFAFAAGNAKGGSVTAGGLPTGAIPGNLILQGSVGGAAPLTSGAIGAHRYKGFTAATAKSTLDADPASLEAAFTSAESSFLGANTEIRESVFNSKRSFSAANGAASSYFPDPSMNARRVSGLEQMANPADLYERAYREAGEIALAQGLKAENVLFGEVQASLQANNGRHVSFVFYAGEDILSMKGTAISVSYFRDFDAPEGKVDFIGSISKGVAVPMLASMSMRFREEVILAPLAALEAARTAGLQRPVGFTLQRHGDGSPRCALSYFFDDERGAQVVVNARTGGVQVIK